MPILTQVAQTVALTHDPDTIRSVMSAREYNRARLRNGIDSIARHDNRWLSARDAARFETPSTVLDSFPDSAPVSIGR
ncbi:hypothetical protein E4V01_08115 [Methylorubrum sp. Q1]|uniref:hypothetical protein n=1 Tax=Methylorubrum sp. Q1 TaxID=2562453 RepID=UPI0010762BA5|nr:hypothetical protein [Methylorubrum sp. Q1]TFZ59400.1 hypothetical protein E4V01_08115 [Methylorubrum sp. Q1]